jgi:hypothetical protein
MYIYIYIYRTIYVESMGKTIFNLFKSYYAQLLKLDANVMDRKDMIAVEESVLKSSAGGGSSILFGSTSSMGSSSAGGSLSSTITGSGSSGAHSHMSKRSEIFTLADNRIQIMETAESAPAILVHVAMAESQKYPFEAIWRSVVKHLIDAATNEFLFIVDFFKTSQQSTFNA